MKVKHIITSCGIITGGIIAGGILAPQNASAAVTYKDGSNVQFSFNPILSLTLSEDGFFIDKMLPNTSANSNEVVATVNTNSTAGYTLSATVGNSTYNSTSLVSGVDTIPMMTSGTELAAGTWGYTLDDGATYGALDTAMSTVINKTVDVTGTAAAGYAGTDATSIKIGAYPAENQANGIYENVINLTVVANPLPAIDINDITYLQEFGVMTEVAKNIVAASMGQNTAYTLIDSRDNQQYTIAKLADGKVWMTTNLNLGDIDHYPLQVAELNSENTNISSPITATTFNSWKKSSGSNTFTDADIVPISGTDAVSGTPYGSLYNYCAASGADFRVCVTNISSQLDPSYDICPAGWRLPTGGYNSELLDIAYYYDNNAATMRSPVASGGPAFALAGWFLNYGSPINKGTVGRYWSSTWESETGMNALFLDTSTVTPVDSNTRANGFSVRCILK